MKLYVLLLLFLVANLSIGKIRAQEVFWTENFGSGCNTGVLADDKLTLNGIWTVSNTGANGDGANIWYISAEENGEGVGNCGAGCGSNPTLHIGWRDADSGASYFKGDPASGLDATTDARAESPIIDCTGKCNVSLSFEYMESGDVTIDNHVLWYFDGVSWTVIDDTPKTQTSCEPQGEWTQYSILLPASAENNPDVQIGFQWLNNNDELGTGTSVAIYNIQLSAAGPSQANIITNELSICDTLSVYLEAKAPDYGTGSWSVETGSGTLNNQMANNTGVNNLAVGENVFVWEVATTYCGVSSDTVTVTVFELPASSSINSDTLFLCADSLKINGNIPHTGVGKWYATNSDVYFLDESNSSTLASNFADKWNNVIWQISNGSCPVSRDTVRVYYHAKPKIKTNDTTLCVAGNEVVLYSEDESGLNYKWSFIQGDGDFDAPFSTQTNVSNLVADDNEIVFSKTHPICGSKSDTVVVFVDLCGFYDPVVPTIFTPNGDGKNDFFVIENLHILYPEANVVIINRWGNVVFESLGYEEPWNGAKFNSGEALPLGTYFYRVVLNDGGAQELRGSISIIK